MKFECPYNLFSGLSRGTLPAPTSTSEVSTTASLDIKEVEQVEVVKEVTEAPEEVVTKADLIVTTSLDEEQTSVAEEIVPEIEVEETTEANLPETETSAETKAKETEAPVSEEEEEQVTETIKVTEDEVLELDQEVKELEKQVTELEEQAVTTEQPVEEVEQVDAENPATIEQVPEQTDDVKPDEEPEEEKPEEVDESSLDDSVPEATAVIETASVEVTTLPTLEPTEVSVVGTEVTELESELPIEISTEEPFLSLQKLFQDQFSQQTATSESPKRRRKVTGSGLLDEPVLQGLTPSAITIGSSLRVSDPNEQNDLSLDDSSVFDPLEETVDESWGLKEESIVVPSITPPQGVNLDKHHDYGEYYIKLERFSNMIRKIVQLFVTVAV
jgi:hypothetical protein